MATMNELRNCYSCVNKVPRRFTTIMLRIFLRLCYDITGSDMVKPRLYYDVNGILQLCNGSTTVCIRF